MTGVITTIKPEKGYGFVRTQQGVDYFFHRSVVEGRFETLREGMSVEFEVDGQAAKGPRAARVAPVTAKPCRTDDDDQAVSVSQH